MDMRPISIAEYTEAVTFKNIPDAYIPDGAGRSRWSISLRLQSLAFKYLKKYGKHVKERVVKYTRHNINPKSFIDKVFEYDEIVVQLNHGNGGKTLYMGPKEFVEFTDNTEPGMMLEFQVEYAQGRTIKGLKVVVLPYMNGMLVV